MWGKLKKIPDETNVSTKLVKRISITQQNGKQRKTDRHSFRLFLLESISDFILLHKRNYPIVFHCYM